MFKRAKNKLQDEKQRAKNLIISKAGWNFHEASRNYSVDGQINLIKLELILQQTNFITGF